MRMIHEEYYEAAPQTKPVPRAASKRTATVTSVIPTKAYGGYGSKTAGSSVGLPSVMPKRTASVRKSTSVRKPSYAKPGGGDEAMATTLDASWGSAEQRRYRR